MPKIPDPDLQALVLLEKSWPEKQTKSVRDAFAMLRSALKKSPAEGEPPTKMPAWPPSETGVTQFESLDLIRRTLMSHDMLFLGRQITYHISASSEMPSVWGNREKVGQALSHLIEHIAKRADRESQINIAISEFALRNGAGIKIDFECSDMNFDVSDTKDILDKLLEDTKDERSGISLSECRDTIIGQHGQMWVDVKKEHRPVYHILLPASESVAREPSADQITFKYDISITNYANVRKRFGIKKSVGLVNQVEHYIRSLVRYPIDMVMAISEKGIITAIYETPKGSANSVASRISQRLGKEEFRIGKRPVELMFKYELSQLGQESADRQETQSRN